jgi:hypothetical protein
MFYGSKRLTFSYQKPWRLQKKKEIVYKDESLWLLNHNYEIDLEI